jgi:hypothetical protein
LPLARSVVQKPTVPQSWRSPTFIELHDADKGAAPHWIPVELVVENVLALDDVGRESRVR